MNPQFIHLCIHTEYSLSDGLSSIPSLIEKAKMEKMPAIAITDESNLFATVKFYQAAIKAGIKPIIGVDLYVTNEKNGKDIERLTLLCQTNEGYKNLLKLVSRSYLDGQTHSKPQVEKAWIEELASGLIALSGGQEGEIGKAILGNDEESARKYLFFWQRIFPHRFYLEISRTGKKEEDTYIKRAVRLAHACNIPLVATNEVRFLAHDDFDAHEARVCIKDGVTLNDPRRQKGYTQQQYFRSQNEMRELFADIPSALKNTVEIAKRCNVTFLLGKSQFPHFSVPDGYNTESYLIEIAKKGLDSRLQTLFANKLSALTQSRSIYEMRLSRELEVINNMGFAGYFLIVADFTKWAKQNGIPVGPGRGSGPGSLVAYALNITDLDPLSHELLFERFLNPERVSLPDFDIDFCIEGRDRVIEYVIQKYGQESVSQIITYGTMAAKAVVRDVGRVLGLGYGFVDKIAKLIPFELGMTLEKAMDQEPLLRERYQLEEEVRTLIDLARKLEGVTRNVGKHAGGIVIAPGKLNEFVPLYCEANDLTHPVTQFDKDDVEAVGLVKFDFLGLKTLTIIDKALKVINQNFKNKNEPIIDISLIPLDDAETFNTLKASQSTAIFQLESPGMRDLIKRLQPDCFDDLVPLVALFRPGPLQSGMVDDFINRKHGRTKVIYPHPALEKILSPTYGVIVYQEQVMQIAQVLAGYTLGAADILRRAMGKKKPEEMAKQREIFCLGAKETQQVGSELANHIFDLMEKFAGYGFNKAHSAAYALISYQTAWLKTHYPAEFMSAVLSSEMDRTEKVIILLDECDALKLHVFPPDINKSDYYFKVIDNKQIVHGLGAIKGVGEAAIDSIVTSRKQSGPFLDLFNFCERVDLRKVNRRVCEALIKSGCFDLFGQHRATLLTSLNNAMSHAEQVLQNRTFGQHDLLEMNSALHAPRYTEVSPWSDEIQLQGEKETLGFYLSGHPLNRFLKESIHFTTCKISELKSSEYQTARLVGIITKIRTRQTKRGDRMAVFSLDDGTSEIEGLCFSDTLQKYRSFLIEDQPILVEGSINIDRLNNNPRIICREILTIDQARERHAKYLQISLSVMESFDLKGFKQLLLTHQGDCPIIIRYERDHIKADIKLGQKWMIKPSENLLNLIQEQFSIQQVGFEY